MEVIKGYKVFNPDWTAQHGNFQYEVGEEYEMDGEIFLCKRGFHFCEKLEDCFDYYDFTPHIKVAEVDGTGQIKRHEDKILCCSRIRIIKEIPMDEALKLVNTGKDNLGVGNQGNGNQGNGNQGNDNQGNGNQGNRSQGDYNQGNRNQGDYNQGNRNQGDYNHGNSNRGDYNRGCYNRGDYNQGDGNRGDCNQGDNNRGNYNHGYRHLGNHNHGSDNIGIGNKGNYIVGLWCTQKQPFYLFNKLCSIPLDEFKQSKNYGLLMRLTQVENPRAEWESFTPEKKQITLSTENISPEILKELFDIDVSKEE